MTSGGGVEASVLSLPDMPLFLEPEMYVPTRLEATYQTTWSICPRSLKDTVLSTLPPEQL